VLVFRQTSPQIVEISDSRKQHMYQDTSRLETDVKSSTSLRQQQPHKKLWKRQAKYTNRTLKRQIANPKTITRPM
jgi:hypothetical protein